MTSRVAEKFKTKHIDSLGKRDISNATQFFSFVLPFNYENFSCNSLLRIGRTKSRLHSLPSERDRLYPIVTNWISEFHVDEMVFFSLIGSDRSPFSWIVQSHNFFWTPRLFLYSWPSNERASRSPVLLPSFVLRNLEILNVDKVWKGNIIFSLRKTFWRCSELSNRRVIRVYRALALSAQQTWWNLVCPLKHHVLRTLKNMYWPAKDIRTFHWLV